MKYSCVSAEQISAVFSFSSKYQIQNYEHKVEERDQCHNFGSS